MKKIFTMFFIISLTLGIFAVSENTANAEKITNVNWGKIKLTSSHVGKVTLSKKVYIYRVDKNKSQLVKVSTAKPGQEYGVYSKKDTKYGVLYAIGSGKYIKHHSSITYKTPHKSLTEVLDKDRVWLRNPIDIENYAGNQVNLYNLSEAIILNKTTDPLDPIFYNVKIKVGKYYYTMRYVDKYNQSAYYTATNPFKKYKFSSSIWNLIKNEEIQVGMTETQTLLSWGYPNEINYYGDKYGSFDQWVYGDPLYSSSYLYFENGKLVSWQDF
ncbi:hypothetical protein FS935_08515 [Metabacillus litoralis]|uniref:Surface layer protein A domain-containing protein n=1 Tax=Metabacillus litoralis TaxID=152268 RepID=A0A5C6W1Y8_9BACI|nr:hypothetical protein [Metabacillus litoralis]TXC90940.1 hypothetical protein FS935_08515 [Metabacillus litoralis]